MSNITQYINRVVIDSESREWSEREGKLFLDRSVMIGDSILLESSDEQSWRSRRILVGPGGEAHLYLHPDCLRLTTIEAWEPPESTEGPLSSIEDLRRQMVEAKARIKRIEEALDKYT